MSANLVQELIDAGIHYGQRRSNWNPKMGRYIYGERNKIHVIDIRETVRGLLLADRFIQTLVAKGKDVCFVGTKRQARGAIEKYAADVGMPWVTERWLGGTLTNFQTIRARLRRLEELERLDATGEIESYSKKMASQLGREKRKIKRNLEGIRTMTSLPGALVIVDTTRELNALREARSLAIPTICLVDTDGDPDLADIPIPGNDDSMRSIEVVVRFLCQSVSKGKQQRPPEAAREEAPAEETGGHGQRRGRGRAMFRADGGSPASSHPADAAVAASPEPTT